jgi:hypothetical protein
MNETLFHEHDNGNFYVLAQREAHKSTAPPNPHNSPEYLDFCGIEDGLRGLRASKRDADFRVFVDGLPLKK